MVDPTLMPVGLVGHGMLLSPACPCRFAREPSGALWIRAGSDAMASITPGTRPAAGDPVAVESAGPPTWRFGDDGPTIRLIGGARLDQVLTRIDAGISDAPWSMLGPGFWIDLPLGFLGFSATTADDPYPELHLRASDLRGPRTVPDAFIQFHARPVPASAVRLTGPHAAEEGTLDTARGPVRIWDYRYDEAGVTWRKRHYALPIDGGSTMLMAAQAPAAHAARMLEGADGVASSFAPARG